MKKRMSFTVNELQSLIDLCNQFETDSVTAVYEAGSGIGYTLQAELDITVKDTKGTFRTEISGVDNW